MRKFERNGLHFLEKKAAQAIGIEDSSHMTKKIAAIFIVLSFNTI